MKRNERTSTFIALFLSIPFLMGLTCSQSIPIREMSLARLEITRALSVKADTYAPAELEEAKKHLFRSHESLRDDAGDKAKESAEASYKKANEAYEKSLPPLAKDTIDEAEKSLAEADEAYAPVLAKDEFEQAQGAVKNAGDQFGNKKYYEAYLSALEADRLARSAVNMARGKQNILSDAIEEVKATLDEAVKYNAGEFAPDKLGAARESLKLASESLTARELRKGFAAVETARISADDAYVESLKRSTREDIVAAELIVTRAEKSEGAGIAKDEMEGAKESLAGAKALYTDSRFKESLISTGEAKRLAAIVLGAKISDPTKKEAKDLSASGKDRKGSLTAGESKEFRIYTVRYNAKQRDCLWRIAGRYYKNPRLWKKIYDANRDTVRNPHIIRPGTRLKIPVLVKPAIVEKKAGTGGKKEPEAILRKDDSPESNKDEITPKDEGDIKTPGDEGKEGSI